MPDYCDCHSKILNEQDHCKAQRAAVAHSQEIAFARLDKKVSYWILTLLVGVFVVISGAQFSQILDIKERVVVLQTQMLMVEKHLDENHNEPGGI